MRTISGLLAALVWVAAAATPTRADLVGANVTGVFQVGGSGLNYFDAVNGFVPPGYLNSGPGSHTTVAISVSQVEFGYQDSSNLITANFGVDSLVLINVSSGRTTPLSFTFTSAAFVGLSLSKLSDSFPTGVTASLVDDRLTITTANYVGAGDTFSAEFRLRSVPEPASIVSALVGVGLAGIGLARFRKR